MLQFGESGGTSILLLTADPIATHSNNEDPFFAAQKAAMPHLSFVDRDRPSAQGRPPTPMRQPATAKRPPAKALLFSIEEKTRAAVPPPQPQRNSAASPSTSKRVGFSSASVEQMEQSFDRRLKKPITLVPNTVSTAQAASRPPTIAAQADVEDSSPEDEAEVDPIALLPTPIPPSFRFVTGPKARPPPKLDLVDEEQDYHLSPEEEQGGPLDLIPETEYEAEKELERAMDDDWDPDVWGEVSVMADEAAVEPNQQVDREKEASFDFYRHTQREGELVLFIRSAYLTSVLACRVACAGPSLLLTRRAHQATRHLLFSPCSSFFQLPSSSRYYVTSTSQEEGSRQE